MNKDDIQLLYEYDRWANHRVLQAASTLTAEQFTRDLGGAFHSLRDTLVHIVAGEWGWLEYWNEPAPNDAFHADLDTAPGRHIQSQCISQRLSSSVEVGGSRETTNRVRESHHKRVPGENDSVPHKASQPRPAHATSREPFHLPSRPSRSDDAPAQRRASIHEPPRISAGRPRRCSYTLELL